MKMFVWADPYKIPYGSTMLVAVAETEDEAREMAVKSPAYAYAAYEDESTPTNVHLGSPTRVVELPCAEWHAWPE